MNLDTLWFFEIFLGGFITVWTYRFFSNKSEKYSEFEWFGSSAFWGLIIVVLVSMLPKKDVIKQLLDNPLATGTVCSFLGILFGYGGSRLIRMVWFKKSLSYLGKGAKDRSEKIF